MKPITEKWLKRVEYDIETARAMLRSNRYQYVIFCCQQSVEKALKALIAEQSEEMPPRIHNLRRLAQSLNLELNESQDILFGFLSQFYIDARYDTFVNELASTVSSEKAKQILKQTEDVLEWLLSRLT